MGGKRKKNQLNEDGFPELGGGNHKTYQSEASKAMAEMAEAKKRE